MWPRVAAINGSVLDSEYEISAPLILQSPIITSVAQVRRSVWSSDSIIDVMVCTESRNHSRSPSEAPGWLCWQKGLSQLKPVPSVGYLHGQRTTLVIWLAKSSVRETEQDQSIQSTWQQLLSRGRGFNLGHAICTCTAASHTYGLSTRRQYYVTINLVIMTSLMSTALLLVEWSWFTFKLDWKVEAVVS